MRSSSDPKSFWENKILSWERDRYGNSEPATLLESFASSASSSLRRRMELARELLVQQVPGKKVLELGCGSGTLSESLIRAGAKSYTGIDIAESAVENARRIAGEKGLSDVVSFDVGEIGKLGLFDIDIVFSLGLSDWLTDIEIWKLFSNFRDAEFLHSFSEKRLSPQQLIHRLYCYVAYGYKTKGYVPRYFSVDQIAEVVREKALYALRDPGMGFCIFLTSFPAPGAKPVQRPE